MVAVRPATQSRGDIPGAPQSRRLRDANTLGTGTWPLVPLAKHEPPTHRRPSSGHLPGRKRPDLSSAGSTVARGPFGSQRRGDPGRLAASRPPNRRLPGRGRAVPAKPVPRSKRALPRRAPPLERLGMPRRAARRQVPNGRLPRLRRSVRALVSMAPGSRFRSRRPVRRPRIRAAKCSTRPARRATLFAPPRPESCAKGGMPSPDLAHSIHRLMHRSRPRRRIGLTCNRACRAVHFQAMRDSNWWRDG